MQISGTPVADLKMLQDLQTNTKRGSRRTEHAPRRRKRKRQRRKSEAEEECLPSLEAGIPEAVTPRPPPTLATIPEVRIDGPPDSNPQPTPRPPESAFPALGASRSLPQLGGPALTTAVGGGVDHARGARSLAPTTSVSPTKRSLRATTSAASVLGGGGSGGGGGAAETSGRPAKRRRLETLSVLPLLLTYLLCLEKLSTDPYSRAGSIGIQTTRSCSRDIRCTTTDSRKESAVNSHTVCL